MKGIWIGIAVLLPIVFGAVGWLTTPGRDVGAIRLLDANYQRVEGRHGDQAVSAFRLTNTSAKAIRPEIKWANCGCVDHEFSHTQVEPGQSFQVTLGLPVGGAEAGFASVVVGATQDSMAASVMVTMEVVPDASTRLLVSPAAFKLSVEQVREGAQVAAWFDVKFACPEYRGDPRRDLEIELDGVTVLEVDATSVASPRPGVFSGRLHVTFLGPRPPESAPFTLRGRVLVAGTAACRDVSIRIQ